MTRAVLWGVAVMAMAALLPLWASVLGDHAAGTIWLDARLSAPYLSQAGDVFAGLIGGLVAGALQKAVVRMRLWPAVVGGAVVGLSHAIWPPLTVLALPIAAGGVALMHKRDLLWVRSQGIAAAWIALALLLPFPRWAQLALIVAAAFVSGWGVSRRSVAPAARP